LLFCQHKESLGLVNCNSSLAALVQGMYVTQCKKKKIISNSRLSSVSLNNARFM